MTTRISLIDEALVLNGSEPLGSETAPGADTYLAAYESAKNLILTSHPWSFCTFTRQLSRYAAPPEIHWLYAFELPAERIGAPRAMFDRPDLRIPFTDYELFGASEVRTNCEQIWCCFTKDIPPGSWPPYVAEVIKLLIRAELALATREDRVMRDKLREDAVGSGGLVMQGGLLAVARGIDDMAKPSPGVGIAENPLIDVRHSGGGWWS